MWTRLMLVCVFAVGMHGQAESADPTNYDGVGAWLSVIIVFAMIGQVFMLLLAALYLSPTMRDFCLRQFLKEVRRNGGWWYSSATRKVAYGINPVFALELVHERPGPNGVPQVLLKFYDGDIRELSGWWCIPGGHPKNRHANFQEVASAIAKSEIGADVMLGPRLDEHWWEQGKGPEKHPHGRPLSLFHGVTVFQPIVERPDLRYFPVNELPENTLGPFVIFVTRRYAKYYM